MANARWMTAEDRCGRNVRRLRERLGLTQAELAARMEPLGVVLHPSTIAKIELRDARTPRTIRLDEADALARALGVSVAELLAGPRQELSAVAQLLEQALWHAGSAQERIDVARTQLAEVGELTTDGLDPDEAVAIQATKDRIDMLMHRLDEIRGEHPETP